MQKTHGRPSVNRNRATDAARQPASVHCGHPPTPTGAGIAPCGGLTALASPSDPPAGRAPPAARDNGRASGCAVCDLAGRHLLAGSRAAAGEGLPRGRTEPVTQSTERSAQLAGWQQCGDGVCYPPPPGVLSAAPREPHSPPPAPWTATGVVRAHSPGLPQGLCASPLTGQPAHPESGASEGTRVLTPPAPCLSALVSSPSSQEKPRCPLGSPGGAPRSPADSL